MTQTTKTGILFSLFHNKDKLCQHILLFSGKGRPCSKHLFLFLSQFNQVTLSEKLRQRNTKSIADTLQCGNRGCSVSVENVCDCGLRKARGNGKSIPLDLSYNYLSELPDDFYARTLPYLSGMDLSYNRFSSFPTDRKSVV